jgi:transglutaminase-like putative cysteine protease
VKPEQQVPRHALVWMIISLFALVAPHATRLPPWVLAVYVFAAVWRIQVYRGHWSFPGWWVKLALTISSFAAILYSYGSMLGLEPMVALLLTAFALKLIELASRKDAYVLLFLGYFICITEFLFSQDLLIVLYVFTVNITLVTTSLIALHQPGQHRFTRSGVRQAGVMLMQAFPLMLVLFFLFPRVGPLWTIPIKTHAGKTGISDHLRPGDISQLSESDEVAFRVRFEGDIPRKSELYWRGLVMSRLRDGAWTSLSYYQVPAAERRPPVTEDTGDPLAYTIIMEPTQQNWLFALRRASSSTPGVMHAADYRLFNPVPVEDEFQYEVRSWPETVLDPELSDWRRETELKIPDQGNPRTRALAVEMRGERDSDADFVQAVLTRFNREPYVYTLKPPLLGEQDSMDQFLFQTRRGFCEHYAYAFVLMMRAAGVPARVVAGYQGGEINPVNQTVIVHQFDAHAWAEVWLEGRGWVRVDPTAAVAPERVELGLEQALAEEGTFLSDSPLSPLRYRNINWLNQIRLQYDALTYRWQSWVVGFDSEGQFELLKRWFGEVSARRFALVFAATWGVVLLLVAISLLRQRERHQLSAPDREYLRMCQRLDRLGATRQRGETPAQFAARVAVEYPHLAEPFAELTAMYASLAYAPADTQAQGQSLALFRRKARAFRPRRRSTATRPA